MQNKRENSLLIRKFYSAKINNGELGIVNGEKVCKSEVPGRR